MIRGFDEDEFGLTEVGAEATRRGLELLDVYGDPEDLRIRFAPLGMTNRGEETA